MSYRLSGGRAEREWGTEHKLKNTEGETRGRFRRELGKMGNVGSVTTWEPLKAAWEAMKTKGTH